MSRAAKKPWPIEAVVIVAPSPAAAIRDPAEPTLDGLCRDCLAAVCVRISSISRAEQADYRLRRPIEFFCVDCAMTCARSSITVFEDLRPGPVGAHQPQE